MGALVLPLQPFVLLAGTWTANKPLAVPALTVSGTTQLGGGLAVTGTASITGPLSVTGTITGTATTANALSPSHLIQTGTTNIGAEITDTGTALQLTPLVPGGTSRGTQLVGFDGTSYHPGVVVNSDGSVGFAGNNATIDHLGNITAAAKQISAATLVLTGNATIGGNLAVTGTVTGTFAIPASQITSGVFGSGVQINASAIVGSIAASSVSANNVTAGTFPTGVYLGAAQLNAGTMPAGVVVPVTLLAPDGATTAIPNALTITASQIVGAITATTVPAGGVQSGTLPGNVYLPAAQVQGTVGAAGSVPASGVTSGTFSNGVYLPAAQVQGTVDQANYANNSGHVNGANITVASTAPNYPYTGDIWIDTSVALS